MQPEESFVMGTPQIVRQNGQYAFWMKTNDKKLLAVVRSMNCVTGMKRSRSTGKILVAINDDHDPDEAWHWIRKELEDAINTVELDDIWHDAIQWLL